MMVYLSAVVGQHSTRRLVLDVTAALLVVEDADVCWLQQLESNSHFHPFKVAVAVAICSI